MRMRDIARHIASRSGRMAVVFALACALALGVGGGMAHAATSFGKLGEFGTPGSGDGEFGESSPKGVAVAEGGEVWATDGGHFRVQKFGSAGEFLFTFGWGVENQENTFQICPSLCGEGISGNGEGQFGRNFFNPGLSATGVAIAPVSGNVYVVDAANKRVEEFSSSGSYLSTFNGSATPAGEFNVPTGVAVAPTTGDVYVMDPERAVVDRFSSSGVYECQISGKAEESEQCDGEASETPQEGFSTTGERTANLAVDSSGDLYVADSEDGVVDEFNPAGAYLKQFPVSVPSAVAVDSVGDVFVSSEANKIVEFEPSETKLTEFGSPEIGNAAGIAVTGSGSGERVYVADAGNNKVWIFGPVVTPTCSTGTPPSSLTATSATLPGTINPEGIKATYYFEYGTSESYGAKTAEVSSWEGDEGTELKGVGESLTELQPHQTYDYQLVASNIHGSSLCGNQTLETQSAKPSIGEEQISGGIGNGNATQTAATLEARINPNNEATHWYFEYGTSPSLSGASTAPTPPGEEIAKGYGDTTASEGVSSLQPNTTYYYRAVASNTGGGTNDGQIESFLTRPATPATGATSGITQTEATLTGTFNPGGHDTHYYFEYGAATCTTTSCESRTTEVDAGAGTNLVEPTTKLSGLEPLTAYHYRLVVTNAAVNGGGPAYGPEREVTTLPLAPGVTTDVPVSVTATSAAVGGEVVAQAASTQYRVEYGPTEGLGSSTAPVDAGSAADGLHVAVSLEGLHPDTTYFYRFAASNSGGEGHGGIETFTTNSAGEPTSVLPAGFSLTGTSLASLAPASFPNLTAFAPPPPAAVTATAMTKPLTKAQKLSKALKTCRKEKSKKKRPSCEKTAKKKYGSTPTMKA
jgi:NHL repeat